MQCLHRYIIPTTPFPRTDESSNSRPRPRSRIHYRAETCDEDKVKIASRSKTMTLPPKVSVITSTSNPFVKHCVKLRQSSSYRHVHGSVLVVGTTIIVEIFRFHKAVSNGPIIDCLFVLDNFCIPEEMDVDSVRVIRVNSEVIRKVSGLQCVDSVEVFALMGTPSTYHAVTNSLHEEDCRSLFSSPHRVLVLDRIQDPGNLGTLIRTATAFRWDGVFLLPGCCDPFNDKALRACRGACFQIPIVSGDWTHFQTLRQAFGMRMLAGHSTTNNDPSPVIRLSQDFAHSLADSPLCLVLGNEGGGLSEVSLRACELVTIQMEGEFESLNVSVADGDPNTYYQTPRKLTGKYASEGYFFQNLRESNFVTDDPDLADLFFIPISCHKMRGKGISYENMTIIVQNYVESLMYKYPYWNRTLGADHFFVTCHDVGVRATEGVPNLVKNSIRVVCSPSYDVGFIPHKDVALPQILQPFALPAGGNDVENRTTLGFWAGHRNSKIRVILARVWENDTELDISNNRINRATGHLVYQKKFYRTKYCICPGGSQVNSARITDSIHYGCIPVILSNYYDLPFNDILNWHKFSIVLKEKDVYQLKQILKNITQEEFVMLHNNLVKVQKHFQWNSPPQSQDAFHMVMYELWLRHHVVKY
ncbi:Exostosin family protein [Striga hermonthica]|uniref:Exostosin family protein n=1 Tax=Striga hermonthica TaxID=68872 RepID=A0A9N7MRE2_STRHE|nr:Exostosin family protein [Striga hermonthica]